MAAVIIDLKPAWRQVDSHRREGLLTIQSGAIRFSVLVTSDDLLNLMLGQSVHLDAEFREFASRGVYLDADTLAMPTRGEGGVRVEARERRKETTK